MSRVPSSQSGQPIHRLLGIHLRTLRTERELTLTEAAPVIRASQAKISRLERGESPPRDRDVLDLVQFYGANTPAERQEIQELLRAAKNPGDWDQFCDLGPGRLSRLIALESAATELRTYAPYFVPGFLQAPAYTHAAVALSLPAAGAIDLHENTAEALDAARSCRSPS